MIRSILFALLLASMYGAASARTLEIMGRAYELDLAQVIMPQATTGTAFVRVCETCESVGHPVTPATRYRIDGRELPLVEFLLEIADIRVTSGGNDSYVTVAYDLASNEVERISVFTE